jgi:predicted DNA-binding transcriptional regulator AlpA
MGRVVLTPSFEVATEKRAGGEVMRRPALTSPLATEPLNPALVRLEAPLRRGLRRFDAARYVGVSPSKFDELVKDGRMPRPKRLDSCVVWDVRRLDVAFDAIEGDDDGPNEWDTA